MTTQTHVPAGGIVVGVDGSDSAKRALDWAAAEAALEHRPVVLAHGTGPSAGTIWASQGALNQRVYLDALREDGQALLVAAHEQITARQPGLEVHEVLRDDDPRSVLLDLSKEAEMVVLGSRGRGPLRSLLLGSVGMAVTKHARCPVVVLRPANPGAVRNGVLVGVDGTEESREVLEFAYGIAAARGLPLTVMHCWWGVVPLVELGVPLVSTNEQNLEEARLLVAESVAGLGEKFPEVRVHTELVHGLADSSLVVASEGMDLVVVGAHQGGVSRQVTHGSVAAAVVEHARTTVAVVPGPS